MTDSAPQIRFCSGRDGVRLAYATCGSGPPLVWVGHPISHLRFDWGSSVWRHWLALLAQRHTLITYNLRGCGLSDRHDVEYSFDRFTEDLEAVVHAAGVQRFALFGISGGGATAVAFSARHPQHVTHLMLHGSFSRGRLARQQASQLIEDTELNLKAIELGFESSNPGMRQFFATIRMPDGSAEQHRAFAELIRLATTPANYCKILRTYFHADVQDLAPLVRCPTIVFHSCEDGVAPFDEGCALAALIPGADFVPLDSRNHLLMEDEPAWKQLVTVLEKFLATSRGGQDAVQPLFNGLTAREHDVLELVAQGLDNTTIGTRLGISERTVRNNVYIIFSKLGVTTRAEAIVGAREAGFGRGQPAMAKAPKSRPPRR